MKMYPAGGHNYVGNGFGQLCFEIGYWNKHKQFKQESFQFLG